MFIYIRASLAFEGCENPEAVILENLAREAAAEASRATVQHKFSMQSQVFYQTLEAQKWLWFNIWNAQVYWPRVLL